MRTLSIAATVLFAACSAPAPRSACPSPGETAEWIGDGPLLACADGALLLALTAPKPLEANGHDLARLTLRVGRDFPLVGVPVALTVTNGALVAGATTGASLEVLTDSTGRASIFVRASTTPGPLVISGEVRAQAGALDAGTGQAKTIVFTTLVPAPIDAIVVTAGPARVDTGSSATWTISGAFDEALRIPAIGAVLDVCTDGSDLLPTPSVLVLGDGGMAQVSVAVASTATTGLRSFRVCPAEEGCTGTSSCRVHAFEVLATRKPILRTLLSAPQDAIVAGQGVTLTVAGYATTDFLVPATERSAVALCASGANLQDTWVQLDAMGKATTRFTAPTAGTIKLTACPFGVDCANATLDERCAALERAVSAPPDAINSFALGLGSPLRANQTSPLTVAAYADARRLVPARSGLSIRLCYDTTHVDGPTAAFLDMNGRATAGLTPRYTPPAPAPSTDAGTLDGGADDAGIGDAGVVDAGVVDAGWPWGPVLVTACPYEVPCSALTPVCETLDAGVP